MAALGYDLVRVRHAAPVLQVMLERKDRANVTVDDCAEASRTVSALLDVEDPIRGAYSLEVSSPGIGRPLTREHDFERFSGYEAQIELEESVEGRRRFRGRLAGLGFGTVLLRTGDGEEPVPLSAIRSARLLVTDDLLEAAAGGGP